MVAAVVVFGLGVSALAGWITGVDVLKVMPFGKVSMNPLTAVSFILLSVALIIFNRPKTSSRLTLAACVGAALVACFSIARFAGIFGFDLEIDRVLFAESLDGNRMAPNTAFCFLLTSLAMLGLSVRFRHSRRICDGLLIASMAVSLIALTGYLYDVQAFYGIAAYIPMALPTAFGFFMLACGIFLSAPHEGLMVTLAGDDMGGRVARRMIPLVVSTPIAFGYLFTVGLRADWFGPVYGVTLLVVLTMIVLAAMTWTCARQISRLDIALSEHNRNLQNSLGQSLTQAQTQVQQLQKLDAIGRLAGGIAHDFNNILGVVQFYCDFMREESAGSQRLLRNVDEIEKATQRGATLTRQLLIFSRTKVAESVVIDVAELLGEHMKMLKALIGESISIEMKMGPELWPIEADPGQIEQIVMNLVINARDAMPKGGKISIEACNEQLSEKFVNSHLSAQTGPHVMLSVSDTGIGMDEVTQSRIFEPFFTTKAVGKGTGLGLSTVYGIVKTYGGTIWVYSELGRGTVFKIYLPASGKAKHIAAAPETGIVLTGNEVILVVEDEENLRTLCTTALTSLGYKVHSAPNAIEAIEILEREGKSINLVLTDIIMPKMDGTDLTRKIWESHPHIDVICMSGYPGDASSEFTADSARVGFLQKPFNTKTLATKIRSRLGAKTAQQNRSA